jgi:hypothetical protein
VLLSSAISQRHHGADTGGRHQAPAHRIVSDDGQQTAMQDNDLFAEHPPYNEQGFDQNGQIRKFLDQLMRVGLYRPVHVKTLRSQKLRMLTHRKLQSKAIAIENDLRGTLRNFGLKVGMVGMAKFEARIKEMRHYLKKTTRRQHRRSSATPNECD